MAGKLLFTMARVAKMPARTRIRYTRFATKWIRKTVVSPSRPDDEAITAFTRFGVDNLTEPRDVQSRPRPAPALPATRVTPPRSSPDADHRGADLLSRTWATPRKSSNYEKKSTR